MSKPQTSSISRRQFIYYSALAASGTALTGYAKPRPRSVSPNEKLNIAGVGVGLAMQGVLGNLVANAIRHTPAGGSVKVAARRSGDRVTLKVTDDGEGIAPDLLPRPGQVRTSRQSGR